MENRIKEQQLDLFADVTCGTIRLKLLRLGALVRLSARRLKLTMSLRLPLAARAPRRIGLARHSGLLTIQTALLRTAQRAPANAPTTVVTVRNAG